MIGEILRIIRIANEDMSLKEVSNKIGISIPYVCKIEKGNSKLSLKNLNKYSQVFNIPKSKIFQWDEEHEDYKHTLIKVLNYYLNEDNNIDCQEIKEYSKTIGNIHKN